MLPGFYSSTGLAIPGSSSDVAQRKAAGWPCHVFRLRYNGVFIPQSLVLGRPIVEGLLVSTREGDGWTVNLHELSGSTTKLLRCLSAARLVKERHDDCRMLAGLEWDEGYLRQWQQTWLCSASQVTGLEVLQQLGPWLRSKYPGKN